MITQSIKDLPEPLTQAHRILMRISEGEIQTYGEKFGTDLARNLHNAHPRTGHVHLSHETEKFWCHFRQTLSSPEGLSSHEEITKHSLTEKSKTQFREQQASKSQEQTGTTATDPVPAALSATPELSEDELQFLDVLRNIGGTARSELQMRIKLRWGQSKTRRIIDLLTGKKKIERIESAGRIIIKLVNSSSHSSLLEKV
jgi:hypothetical protein